MRVPKIPHASTPSCQLAGSLSGCWLHDHGNGIAGGTTSSLYPAVTIRRSMITTQHQRRLLVIPRATVQSSSPDFSTTPGLVAPPSIEPHTQPASPQGCTIATSTCTAVAALTVLVLLSHLKCLMTTTYLPSCTTIMKLININACFVLPFIAFFFGRCLLLLPSNVPAVSTFVHQSIQDIVTSPSFPVVLYASVTVTPATAYAPVLLFLVFLGATCGTLIFKNLLPPFEKMLTWRDEVIRGGWWSTRCHDEMSLARLSNRNASSMKGDWWHYLNIGDHMTMPSSGDLITLEDFWFYVVLLLVFGGLYHLYFHVQINFSSKDKRKFS